MADLPPHDEACSIAGCLPSCERRHAYNRMEVEEYKAKIATDLDKLMVGITVLGPDTFDTFEPGIAKKLIGVPVRGTDGAVVGEVIEAEERIEIDGHNIHVHVKARLSRPIVAIDIQSVSIE